MMSALYAAAARRRREWYASRPDARRRLRHPVVSIGNIAAGGRGKTPFVASVARMLLEMGERPAILSRGYGRTDPRDGVVVVRDATGMRADVASAGDEPFMLARQVPGSIVVVSPDRYLAGRLAEHHFGATVHVLDDGFQHFRMDRDIDIVLVTSGDLTAETFPRGRLREPADVLIAADAIVALDTAEVPAGHAPVFRARRTVGSIVFDGPSPKPSPVFALAGIADPAGFFTTLRDAGLDLVATKAFRDHHPYTARDIARIFGEAAARGAGSIVTTEKDYVRLLPFRPFRLPVGWVPLTMVAEPADAFRAWLRTSMASARDIVLG
jgi:tetraacyldisaccharide 4'-kinase